MMVQIRAGPNTAEAISTAGAPLQDQVRIVGFVQVAEGLDVVEAVKEGVGVGVGGVRVGVGVRRIVRNQTVHIIGFPFFLHVDR